MPSSIFKVELARVPGKAVGLAGVAIPGGGGVLVTELPGKEAAERLQTGDRILLSNGLRVTTNLQLMEGVMKRMDKAVFSVARTTKSPDLPAPWDSLIGKKKEGVDYQVVTVNMKQFPRKPLGLGVTEFPTRVVVTELTENSVAARTFWLMDRVVAVNNQQVRSADGMRQAVIRSGGVFNALIERPQSLVAHMNVLLEIQPQTPKEEPWPEFDPASDIQMIVDSARKSKSPKEEKAEGKVNGILGRNASPDRKEVKVESEHKSIMIRMDSDPDKPLKKIGPRYT